MRIVIAALFIGTVGLQGLAQADDPPAGFSFVYLGGELLDTAEGLALDAQNNVYIIGRTYSTGWISGGWIDTPGGWLEEPYLAKFGTDGQQLWSTYLGGSFQDHVSAVVVDGAGDVIAAGGTQSAGWVSGGWQPDHGERRWAGYVVKLDSEGEHLWSTYFSAGNFGSSRSRIHDVAVDQEGNIFVAGETDHEEAVAPPTAPRSPVSGPSAGFVAKLGPDGEYKWFTMLDGPWSDRAKAVAAAPDGSVYVAGNTHSTNPDPPGDWISGGWDTSFNGGQDGFVAKLGPGGEHLWSSYLGGPEWDRVRDLAVDSQGNVLIVGTTEHGNWLSGGWLTSEEPNFGGFLVKLAPDGQHLWSTYLGGENGDTARSIALDAEDSIHVAGITQSPGWISHALGDPGLENESKGNGAVEEGEIPPAPSYIAKLAPDGEHLWSTYLAWPGSMRLGALAIDAEGGFHVVGMAWPEEWLEAGEPGPHYGEGDGVLVRFVDPEESFWAIY